MCTLQEDRENRETQEVRVVLVLPISLEVHAPNLPLGPEITIEMRRLELIDANGYS
jgi:hypothetical protein